MESHQPNNSGNVVKKTDGIKFFRKLRKALKTNLKTIEKIRYRYKLLRNKRLAEEKLQSNQTKKIQHLLQSQNEYLAQLDLLYKMMKQNLKEIYRLIMENELAFINKEITQLKQQIVLRRHIPMWRMKPPMFQQGVAEQLTTDS